MASSSIKHKGSDSILFLAEKGTLLSSGVMAADTWYKIESVGTATAMPTLGVGGIFKTPKKTNAAITLASGDRAWPLSLSIICKVDVEISGEMGTIETTDSSDYPYNTSLTDGYTSLSGSLNTMLRFDESNDKLIPVTLELLGKFFTIVNDSGAGVYTITAKDDEELLLMIWLNKQQTTTGCYENWIITPAVLTSASMNVALKDVYKGDFSWTKGQGPASIYTRALV